MDRSTHSRQMPGQQRQNSALSRALLALCGCAGMGFMFAGLAPALADEEQVERGDSLILSYQIYNDGTVDAAWGAGTKPRKVEGEGLVPVEIRLPRELAERLERAKDENFSDEVTGGTLEILVFIGGYSTCGSRCHWIGGSEHCHICP